MAHLASVSAFETVEDNQPRWSPRRRTMVILTMAAAAWALPVGLIYGLSRIFL